MKARRPFPRPTLTFLHSERGAFCTVKGPYLSRYGPFIQLFMPSAAIRPR